MSHRGIFNKTHLLSPDLDEKAARLQSTGSSIGTIAVSLISCRPSPALLGGLFLTMDMRNHTPLGLLTAALLSLTQTKRHFRDRHEVIDDDSEAYCWRRSGFFWRMRASLGLACAQATTLAAQIFGKGNPRSRAGRTSA